MSTSIRIALVEDDYDIAIKIINTFSEIGFTVDHFYHPDNLYIALRHTVYNLYIVDFNLGLTDINGVICAQQISKINPSAQIVGMSANDRAKKYFLDDNVTKAFYYKREPFSALKEIVLRLLVNE